MSDYEVGYGKPPKHSRFRKGVCANPRGRGKRRPFEAEEILKEVLFAEMDYKEGGKVRRASRPEIAARTLAAKAVKGDIASAVQLLKIRTHAQKHGDAGPLVIRVINALPELLTPSTRPIPRNRDFAPSGSLESCHCQSPPPFDPSADQYGPS